MLNFIKVGFWWMLMRVEITVPDKPNIYYMRYKTKFVFIPRKVPCFIFFILIAVPVIFFSEGIKGVQKSWKDVFRTLDYSSFCFIGEKEAYVPTKYECYSKM